MAYSAGKKSSCDIKLLAKNFNGFSCAQIESVINRAALIANQQNREEFSAQDIQEALKEI